jgi:hypothetical protein
MRAGVTRRLKQLAFRALAKIIASFGGYIGWKAGARPVIDHQIPLAGALVEHRYADIAA